VFVLSYYIIIIISPSYYSHPPYLPTYLPTYLSISIQHHLSWASFFFLSLSTPTHLLTYLPTYSSAFSTTSPELPSSSCPFPPPHIYFLCSTYFVWGSYTKKKKDIIVRTLLPSFAWKLTALTRVSGLLPNYIPLPPPLPPFFHFPLWHEKWGVWMTHGLAVFYS